MLSSPTAALVEQDSPESGCSTKTAALVEEDSPESGCSTKTAALEQQRNFQEKDNLFNKGSRKLSLK